MYCLEHTLDIIIIIHMLVIWLVAHENYNELRKKQYRKLTT